MNLKPCHACGGKRTTPLRGKWEGVERPLCESCKFEAACKGPPVITPPSLAGLVQRVEKARSEGHEWRIRVEG